MFNEFSKNAKIIEKGKNKIKNIYNNLEIRLDSIELYKKKIYRNESPYLRQYKKYFHKKLSIKYNILPK